MRRDYWVTVCDKCRCAVCWHGEMMCLDAYTAGTTDVKASDLRKERNEHPSWFTQKRLKLICGSVSYVDPEGA